MDNTPLAAIVRYTAAELGERSQLRDACWSLCRAELWGLPEVQQHTVEGGDLTAVSFVVTQEDRTVGCVQFDPRTGRLSQLVVASSHRRTG